MTEAWGNLSGPGPQQVYINVYRTGQNFDGNYSSFHAIVRYVGGGGSWINSAQSWGADLGGWSIGGTFTIPQSQANATQTLWEGDFNRGHDANGYLGGFASSASISTNHSSIGSGSVSVWEGDAPRIPKPPSAPGAPIGSQILPTSMRFDWSGPSDEGGIGLDQMLLRRANNSAMTGYTDYVFGGGVRSAVISDLTPGTRYYWQVYAHNGRGYSPASSQTNYETLAGGRAWDGSSWRNCKVRMWNGSAWQLVRVRQWNGSSWVNTR